MGAKTVDEARRNRIKFTAIDRETGLLMIEDKPFGSVEGKLLGFNQHTFDYKGTPQKKFDVFLIDDGIYQIQIGFYSWVNFRLLNQIVNIENIKNGGLIEVSTNMVDDNVSIFVSWNGKNLKHKYKWADLKLDGKNAEEKQAHRNKIIDKWYAYLMELMPYDPKEAAAEPVVNGDVGAAMKDDDDLPF